jgi:signal transduction histidine kinase
MRGSRQGLVCSRRIYTKRSTEMSTIMRKRAILRFIKDNLLISIIYFITMALIVLFYHITSDSKVEIFYPLSIALYGYLLIMIIKGISYTSFYMKIRKSINNPEYQLQSNTELHKEVVSVINELHNKYINQLNTLKADNEWQQRFLSQWIHELKTNISVINFTCSKEQESLAKAKESFISIADENDKLHNNVEHLLSIIRLNNFEKDYNPEKIDLVKEIRQILGGLKKRFVIHNTFPEIMVETKNTSIFTDKKWHRLMVEQFIINAMKYSDIPLEEIPLDTQEDDSLPSYHRIWLNISTGKDDLVLSIRDEGIGIPSYDLNRVFEPFFTGDNGRRVSNSTGIGLYIADRISKRLGHKLEINSKQEKGTTISIHYLSKL